MNANKRLGYHFALPEKRALFAKVDCAMITVTFVRPVTTTESFW